MDKEPTSLNLHVCCLAKSNIRHETVLYRWIYICLITSDLSFMNSYLFDLFSPKLQSHVRRLLATLTSAIQQKAPMWRKAHICDWKCKIVSFLSSRNEEDMERRNEKTSGVEKKKRRREQWDDFRLDWEHLWKDLWWMICKCCENFAARMQHPNKRPPVYGFADWSQKHTGHI